MRRVKLIKYLGMIVDDKLTWSQHVDYISSKITRNIGILKRIRHLFPRIPAVTLSFFNRAIFQVLQYCLGIVQ